MRAFVNALEDDKTASLAVEPPNPFASTPETASHHTQANWKLFGALHWYTHCRLNEFSIYLNLNIKFASDLIESCSRHKAWEGILCHPTRTCLANKNTSRPLLAGPSVLSRTGTVVM